MAAINPDHRDRHSFAQSFSRGGFSLDVPAKQQPTTPRLDSKIKAALLEEWDSFKLPFTLAEVYDDYKRCRELVSAEDWEDKIETHIMKFTYHSGLKHKLSDRLDLTVYTLDESHIAREEETVCLIARLFDEIRGMLFKDLSNGGNFETMWMELHADSRKSIMYGALNYAGRETGEPRYNCPDITVPRFACDDPKALILMLRQVVQSAIDHPYKNDYYPIECELFDNSYSINRDPVSAEIPIERAQRGLQNIHLNRRHHYIAHFFGALLTVCGYGTSSEGARDHETSALLFKPRVKSSSEIQKLQVKNNRRTNLADKAACGCAPCLENQPKLKSEREVCECCQRSLSQCGELVRFLYCSKCLALSPSRRYAYCSRECQVADYKQGAHRFVCGKPISEWSTDLGSTPRPSPPRTLSLQWLLSEIKTKNKLAVKMHAKSTLLENASSPPKELVYIIRTTYYSLPPVWRKPLEDVQGDDGDEKGSDEGAGVNPIPLRFIYSDEFRFLCSFEALKPFFQGASRNSPASLDNLNDLIRLFGGLYGEEDEIGTILKQVWEDFDQVLAWERVVDLAIEGSELERQWMWNVLHQVEGFYDEIC